MTIEGIFWLIGVIAFVAHVQIAIQTADMARSLRRLERRLIEREELPQ